MKPPTHASTRAPGHARRLGRRGYALLLLVVTSIVTGLVAAGLAMPAALTATAATDDLMSVWRKMPNQPPSDVMPQRSVLEDRYGTPFATIWSMDRVPVASAQIPQVMKLAQISIEDTRFFDHGTLDPRSVTRALVRGDSGGSTITQQYVKNLRFYEATTAQQQQAATAHTLGRKIAELRMAVHLERTMTKDQILTGYLNTVAYGDGTYGVEAASEHYFSHPAKQLTLAQAALLAGVVQQPTALDPAVHPQAARTRRNVVLADMLSAGRISRNAYRAAVASPVVLHLHRTPNSCTTSKYPFYCQQVMTALANEPALGDSPAARTLALTRGGLTVRTALDPSAMAAANRAAEQALGDDNQFAAGTAMVQPGTGQVLAIGQNRTIDQTRMVYATSGFQNGSTFKPITLAAALQDGWDANAEMYAPSSITVGGQTFHNESSADTGLMTAGNAIAVSSNTFFVKLETQATSVAHVQALARQLGWTFPSNTTGTETATTLGVYDVSPVTVANAYATFANHGAYCAPTWVLSVQRGGKQLPMAGPSCKQVVSRTIADEVVQALRQTVDGANPNRTGAKLSLGRPVIGKTGTTNTNAAVWFAGGTPQVMTAVWVGDPRGGFAHPVNSIRMYGSFTNGVFGATTAGPIWQDTMRRYLSGLPVVDFSR